MQFRKREEKRALADVNRHCKMMSVMVLDAITSFGRLKDARHTCKCMRNSPTFAGFLQCNGGNLEETEVSSFIIGITHVFSCINICRVPRMLFEHEADRPSVQTSSEGPGKC